MLMRAPKALSPALLWNRKQGFCQQDSELSEYISVSTEVYIRIKLFFLMGMFGFFSFAKHFDVGA